MNKKQEKMDFSGDSQEFSPDLIQAIEAHAGFNQENIGEHYD